ncbi:hypothetical protein K493DRAFT_315661 [Basidiobolus meristosporus CBS 931.73]|uniref:Zn(2)-C6 fungal-type domain-containing protein n=1 Tax=Basidiobolus meristosporus CBS 931.73 TaxID=1314790 RepID=A0A1Y1Y7U3_9FUNG|nr:hypothetical protein K493DRAFT_315661 [Basidiobolus meristosporus CBS 931.73]|eukprot:ORX94092.1 hypothetical protein K493DRAFT_315661 [Basidiobolus meristosporus CBS 931.73]
MERERSKFLLHSPVVEEEAKDFSVRELTWSSESHLKRQSELCFDSKAHKTKRPSSDDSSSEPTRSSNSKRVNKTHVPSACANCKKAHLACDVSRPCKRCIAMGKTDTCIDIQHKKRGRPKIRDRKSDSYLQDSNYSQIINLNPTPTPVPVPAPAPIPPPIHAYTTQTDLQSTSGSSSSSTVTNNVPLTYRTSMNHPKPPELCIEASNYPCQTPSSSVSIRRSSTPSTLSLASHHTTHFQGPANDEPPSSLHYNLFDPSKSEHHNPQDDSTPHTSDSRDFVMLLNFKMDCAMISEEYHDLLGYTSQDLVHRSLYDIVHITDTDRIENLKTKLIDHVVKVVTDYQGSFLAAPLREGFGCSLTLGDIQKQSYEKLTNPASGSMDVTEAIHIRRKDGGYELFNVHMKVGGAFGTDLTSIDTYDRAYLICKLAKFQLPSLVRNTNNYGSSS